MNHIIYHANCNDGFGAFVVAARALDDETIKAVAGHYGDDFNDLTEYNSDDTIYILDFSVEPSILVEMCKHVNKVVWLDHHASAINKWKYSGLEQPDNLDIILDLYRSGTGITWEYFFPFSPRPIWVNWIEDRDLGQFQYLSSKQFHAGLSSHKKSIPVWNDLLRTESGLENLVADGAAILRAHEQRVKEICDGCTVPITIDGQTGLAANCSGYYASDVGHELAERSGTFGATWYQDASGNNKWSLRARTPSDAPVNVAKIAEKFGGGGHAAAAGFTIGHTATNPGDSTIHLRSSAPTQELDVVGDRQDVALSEAESKESKNE